VSIVLFGSAIDDLVLTERLGLTSYVVSLVKKALVSLMAKISRAERHISEPPQSRKTWELC
jgi:hypothetical protein